MTDEQIIKALECCGEDSDCKHCPYYVNERHTCGKYFNKNVLDLINRQKAEIERSTALFDKYAEANKSKTLNEWLDYIRDIRAEAVKEFAERAIKKICEKVYAPTPVQSCIVEKCNQVIVETVKEMVGENK